MNLEWGKKQQQKMNGMQLEKRDIDKLNKAISLLVPLFDQLISIVETLVNTIPILSLERVRRNTGSLEKKGIKTTKGK